MPLRATWVVLVFSAVLGAQENVIRVDTRLVQVNVIVQHKDGTSAKDLSKEDFTLLDNGKPQKISFFSADRAGALPDSPKLPPNVFGNNPLENVRSGGVTIVLLDGTNTRLADQSFAREHLARFLTQLNPSDQVAVYALGSTLRILQNFTNDSEQLQRLAARYRGAASAELAAQDMKSPTTGVAIIDAILREIDASAADQAQAIRIRRTYDALTAIAEHVAPIPGRKNLVWLSSAFPLTMGLDDPGAFRNARREKSAFSEERERAIRALVKANIAIYPVDARGLVGAAAAMSADTSSSGRTRTSLPSAIVRERDAGIDTMEQLASATGGRAFHGTNDLANAVRNAVNDASITYTLGFYPDPGRLDGKFHELEVKLKRKGVNLRYRKGYTAYPDSPPDTAQREAAIQMALWSPLPSTGITLLGRAERVSNPEPDTVQLAVVADAHQVRINPSADRWTGKIDVTFAQLDPEGRLLEAKRDAVNLHLDQPTYTDIMKSGLLLTRALKPVGNASQIRVVVYDYLTGALGSLIIPLSSVQ